MGAWVVKNSFLFLWCGVKFIITRTKFPSFFANFQLTSDFMIESLVLYLFTATVWPLKFPLKTRPKKRKIAYSSTIVYFTKKSIDLNLWAKVGDWWGIHNCKIFCKNLQYTQSYEPLKKMDHSGFCSIWKTWTFVWGGIRSCDPAHSIHTESHNKIHLE